MTPETTTQRDQEYLDYMDRQALEYPTVTRDETGEWNWFDVTPERAQWISEDGQWRLLDGVDDHEVQASQGEALAYDTLKLAGLGREMDYTTAMCVLMAACEALNDARLGSVATGFMDAVLEAAIRETE